MINLNLLGNNICRNINIENYKNQIVKSYKKYHSLISEAENKNKENAFKKIDNYINNIESISDPKEEGKKIEDYISKLNEENSTVIYNHIQEFIKELEKIKSDLKEKIIINNPKINFNDSVFKNFYSKGHLLGHVGTAVAEGIGIAGLLYAGAAVTGPVGWGITIGIHVVIALGNYVYNKKKKKKTLIENMKEFKKNFEIKFEGNKDKIETIILKMKNDTEKEIEKFVDSQNSEFKGIKLHKSEYEKIYSHFKCMYIFISNGNNNYLNCFDDRK